MRIVIVGAGMAGLSAARCLVPHGHDVLLLDKGRSPGGRLATRRIGTATVDHGAQFFTVRTPEFQSDVDSLIESGLVHLWSHGFATDDGHPRYVVGGGMNRLAKAWAEPLDVRCDALVFAVHPDPTGGWTVVLDDASRHHADVVVLTTPLPQTLSLLATSGVELPRDLVMTDYDRIFGLLVVTERAPALPAPGAVQFADDTFGFIADNQAKGVSVVPSVTFHTHAALAESWWDRDPGEVERDLLERAAPWLSGAPVLESQLKRWRFARPKRLWPEPCWTSGGPSPVVLAGDAFAGPWVTDGAGQSNLEGAYWSGRAAAAAIADPASTGSISAT